MGHSIKVLGLSGSLRRGSYNTATLRAAQQLAPDGMAIEICDLSQIPLYNEDLRAAGFPDSVQRLREQVTSADALLFATPEYNFSLPAVLKNAIDWGSRPPDQPFNGKPGAIMGATIGLRGTSRAQIHLRLVCVAVNILLINKPEVMIASAKTKFDEHGALVDAPTREFIKEALISLQQWVARLDRSSPRA